MLFKQVLLACIKIVTLSVSSFMASYFQTVPYNKSTYRQVQNIFFYSNNPGE